jgi:hypothetical protein
MSAGALSDPSKTRINIMKKLITYMAAGLLVVGAQSLLAQSTNTNSVPPNTQTPGAQRRAHMAGILKLLGLKPADLKGLTREERQAKIKETANTVVAELQAQKAGGTLTAEGQTRLDRIEKFLAHAGHNKNAAAPSAN